MIIEAERRFPGRIRVGVPLEGLGGRLDQMRAWLDANYGADGWALTPTGMRGVLNDALSVYNLRTPQTLGSRPVSVKPGNSGKRQENGYP